MINANRRATKLGLIGLITLFWIGCSDTKSETVAACIVCLSGGNGASAPYVDCSDTTSETYPLYCEDGGDSGPQCESVASCCARAPVGSEGCPNVAPDPTDISIINNQSLSAVPGQIILTGQLGEQTHIFSIDRVNDELYQLTTNEGQYRAISIGVDRRYILFSRIEASGNAMVWLYDMQSKREQPISPVDCDAGRHGVGWFNDSFVGFSMKCPGDAFAQAYLGNIYEDNERNTLRQLTDHEADVVEVYPILNSTFFLYARVDPPCTEDGCMATSTIWMGDNEITTQQCEITQFDVGEDNPERAITGRLKRLGDYRPSISPDLQSILFSRTVGTKPQGPIGHHDIWMADTNIRALLGGGLECGGAITSLTATIESDRWISTDLNLTILHEYAPTAPFPNDNPSVSHLFVGVSYGDVSDAAVYESSVDGSLLRRTPPELQVFDATWIQDELVLSGSR